MKKTRNIHGITSPRRRPCLCALIPLGLIMTVAASGCTTTPTTHSGDPLFGEYYPKGPNGQPMPPPTPGANKTAAVGVPPYPSSNSATSTAALAGLSGGRSLAIDEKNNWAFINPANAATPPANRAPVVQPIPRETPAHSGPVAATSPAPTNAATAVSLANPPGSVIPAGSWSTPSPAATPATPPPMGVLTPEVLQGTLQSKGAINIKQETVADGVRVSCYVPQRSNPSNLVYLETVARDYVSGLQGAGAASRSAAVADLANTCRTALLSRRGFGRLRRAVSQSTLYSCRISQPNSDPSTHSQRAPQARTKARFRASRCQGYRCHVPDCSARSARNHRVWLPVVLSSHRSSP